MSEGEAVRWSRGRKEEVPRRDRRGEVERETSVVARFEREELNAATSEGEEDKEKQSTGSESIEN